MNARYSLLLLLGVATQLQALTFRGEVGAEGRYFLYESPYVDYQTNGSVYLRPEWFHESDDRKHLLTFIPYARLDQHDDRRQQADIRELSWIYVGQGWETRIGINRVFWGVTEGRDLVDIINQTDLVDDPAGDEKLGQPMVNFSTVQDWGILDLYVLPGFRERRFAGEEGRPGFPIKVSRDAAYDSSSENTRIDGAIRWQGLFNRWRVALSHFSGTSREPVLMPNIEEAFAAGWQGQGDLPDGFNPGLTPRYSVVDRTGLEIQYLHEGWLWKFEGISQSGQGGRFTAANAGLEYTQVGIFDTWVDLGWIIEYLWEDREAVLRSPFDNDWLIGHRLTFNDMASTEFLWGLIMDARTRERLFTLEGSRRLSDRWRLSLQGQFYAGSDDPPSAEELFTMAAQEQRPEGFAVMSRDSHLQMTLVYFF